MSYFGYKSQGGYLHGCPCGFYGEERCRCSDYEVLKYRRKLSGPILDRMDIQKYVQPVNFLDLTGEGGLV